MKRMTAALAVLFVFVFDRAFAAVDNCLICPKLRLDVFENAEKTVLMNTALRSHNDDKAFTYECKSGSRYELRDDFFVFTFDVEKMNITGEINDIAYGRKRFWKPAPSTATLQGIENVRWIDAKKNFDNSISKFFAKGFSKLGKILVSSYVPVQYPELLKNMHLTINDDFVYFNTTESGDQHMGGHYAKTSMNDLKKGKYIMRLRHDGNEAKQLYVMKDGIILAQVQVVNGIMTQFTKYDLKQALKPVSVYCVTTPDSMKTSISDLMGKTPIDTVVLDDQLDPQNAQRIMLYRDGDDEFTFNKKGNNLVHDKEYPFRFENQEWAISDDEQQ